MVVNTNIQPSETDKTFLISRGVKLFSAALVGRMADGNYLVNNFVPMTREERQGVIDAGFTIVSEWIIGHSMLDADQWFIFHDAQEAKHA